MNRRQFTASLAALFAAPALPVAARLRVAATPAVPAGAYAWAQIIAQSKNTCSPGMLARALHLRPEVAQILFKDMVVDGVLRAPSATGIAKAAHPFKASPLEHPNPNRIRSKIKQLWDDTVIPDADAETPTALVNPDETGLGCPQTNAEDAADARTDQSPKESPDRG